MGGKSLVGLLRGGVPASSFNASYSQIQRGGNRQGISVRTDRWRYTEWVKFDYVKGLPIFVENNTDVELYDHLGDDENDFDAYENVNDVSDPANAAVVAELAAALRWMHRDADPSPAVELQRDASCLSISSTTDDIAIGPCGAAAAWRVLDDSMELQSVARPELCANVYGGVDACGNGTRVHLATCGGRAGNHFAWQEASKAVIAEAIGPKCKGLCLDANVGGAFLRDCTSAEPWALTQAYASALLV